MVTAIVTVRNSVDWADVLHRWPRPGTRMCVGIWVKHHPSNTHRHTHVYTHIHVNTHTNTHSHFPGGSDGKESSCNTGHPGLIRESGRSPGEGNGYPHHYSCLENPKDRRAWQTTVHGAEKSRTINIHIITYKHIHTYP